MYPVTYTAEFVEKRSRLSNFFRYFMLLPLYLVGFFWAIALLVSVIVAWFALVFTGRYPQALYDFNAKSARFFTRVNAYGLLLTDAYPPFNGEDDAAYPVRMQIAPPLEQYSRMKVLFRFLVGIPVWVMNYLYGVLTGVVMVCSWVVIVITGKQIVGLQDLTKLAAAYQAKATAYGLLLTETYPPVTEQAQLESTAGSPQLG